ncbi:MAG: hypothetical protein R3F37_11760 [Candidatus Competibacteraceae bacterium]
MAFNYSNLVEGKIPLPFAPLIIAKAIPMVSVVFNTTRFDNTFINDPTAISLANAMTSHNDSSIFVDNLTADGQNYDVRLDWRTATRLRDYPD